MRFDRSAEVRNKKASAITEAYEIDGAEGRI
jgi:hypothetical protein